MDRTPLHEAAGRGFYDIVKLLVDNKADSTYVDNTGNIAVKLAHDNGYDSITKCLISQCQNNSVFEEAVVEELIENSGSPLDIILQKGVLRKALFNKSFNCVYEVFIHNVRQLALQRNWISSFIRRYLLKKNIPVVKCLCSHWTDVGSNGTDIKELLSLASQMENIEIVNNLQQILQITDINVCGKKISKSYEKAQKKAHEVGPDFSQKENNFKNFSEDFALLDSVESNSPDIEMHLENCFTKELCKSEENLTSLLTASNNELTEIVKYFAEHGADINVCTHRNCTALFMATSKQNTVAVKQLVENGSDTNISAKKGNTGIVKDLIEHGANVNICSEINCTPLLIASKYGHNKIMKYLMEYGTCFSALHTGNNTPLVLESTNCVNQNSYRQFKIHTTLEESKYQPLQENRNDSTVKPLKQIEIDTSQYEYIGNCTPLLIATRNGHKEIVQLLVKHGADVNICTDKNTTPLFVASRDGNFEIVKYLVDHGADINICTERNYSPVCIATENGQSRIVQYLLEHGANVNNCVNEKCIPLFMAS
ncbi:kinase D-interacting substrate of 220 kDa B-like [Saccostrea echinata]|uniref:kinase D-interacting substrate of 220 kDa B-like n=1 Tax=Saccostrea echinata TaxID=191078 RepID=UPI002A821F5F|nr:kinase D-interacting substrate of 220 kDa B-like [Saccostrea echinata]